MEMPRLALALPALVLLSGCGGGEKVAYSTVAYSTGADYRDAGELCVVATEEGLREAKRHVPAFTGERVAREVDLATEVLAVSFGGMAPDTSYGYTITEVRVDGERLRVKGKNGSEGGSSALLMVSVPYHAFTVARADAPDIVDDCDLAG